MGERVKRELAARASDFELADTRGKLVRLSDFRGKDIVLVLNRGFT